MTLKIIMLLCIAFIFGAVAGAILIGMCISNEVYDSDCESFKQGDAQGFARGKMAGRAEMRDEMMSLCSHCGMVGPSFDELNVGD